jgi:hypothetical protein
MFLSTTYLKHIAIAMVIATILLSSCSTNHNIVNSKDSEFLIEQGDFNWSERSIPYKAKSAMMFYLRAIDPIETNLELSAKFLQASYFYAHYIETVSTVRDSIFWDAANHAIELIHKSEEYIVADVTNTLGIKETEIQAINNLGEEYVSIIYWWVANLGRYLIDKPVSERLKFSDVIKAGLDYLIATNPDYYYSGPYRLLGTFYVRVPGFDVEIAQTFFQKSLDEYPNCFSTSVLMARFCCTKANNREHFHNVLENVVNSNPYEIPEIGPENVFEQRAARELLKMEFLLFE